MSAGKQSTFSSRQDMLDALVENLVLPEDYARVGRAYVGIEPLKCSRRDISFLGVNYVDDNGVVINTDLFDQPYLYKGIFKKFGVRARHGTLKENLRAAHSIIEYKSLLSLYWVYTGQVIRKFDKKYEVASIVDIDFVKEKVPAILVERNGKNLATESSTIVVQKVTLGPVLQTTIPTRSGYYTNFSGAIPIDSELGEYRKKRKGWFGCIYFDDQGLSAVGCYWDSAVGEVLSAFARRPLLESYPGALSVWTDENPKK